MNLKSILFTLALLLACAGAYAQSSLSAVLLDSVSGEPVGFATVSLTREGAQKPSKYVLSDSDGKVEITDVRSGKYVLKAELLGYKTLSRELSFPDTHELGELRMEPDREQLDAASVSAVGNPIIIKKDTIEYNASSFKTTDNDVLEDLLRKLPGLEVSEDGTITANGKTISKITIDGKTFFLDDPQLASKNIPAKIINKLKVVDKKSDQAEFTGIDDGEEETIIDLSIKPGMMNGSFGNIMAGGGHDVPSTQVDGDWRYQGAAFIGKFTDKTQLSLILNGNNTNNRGFNDLAGSMMGNMRGGGGGMGGGRGGNMSDNGITTSYMGGGNGSWTLFDGDMDLGANALVNYTNKDVLERSSKTTYLSDRNMLYRTYGADGVDSNASNITTSWGPRFGIRLEHKFSENTSIIFEPRVNFGFGSYAQSSYYDTWYDYLDGNEKSKVNEGSTTNTGDNRNLNASGFALLRQKLGKPGRTLTAMARYSFSNNELDAFNYSSVSSFNTEGEWVNDPTNQKVGQKSTTSSVMGRVTYTEPLGGDFYLEANYAYNWNRSESNKRTDDKEGEAWVYNPNYSSEVLNILNSHTIGANLMYQKDEFRAQLGFSAIPTRTRNYSKRNNIDMAPYDSTRWRFAPQAMLWWEMGENANMRMFYRGSSEQPSVSQLIPVPDNTDPLNISFGNPYLDSHFSHSLMGDYRYNNKKTFASVNVRFNGSYVQDPVVSAIWYGPNGARFSMPFNGPDSFSGGFNVFANIPIGQTNFSISEMARANYSKTASYVGGDQVSALIGDYYNSETGDMDYEKFKNDYIAKKFSFDENITRTVSATERIRVTYRNDNLELSASYRTRINKSWYTIADVKDNTLTFNHQARATANWTWDLAGLTLKSEYSFNWYDGYSKELNYTPEHILNAEIQKLLFNNKLTLALKGYDILGQAKNLSVSDSANYHSEVFNNTLGRYIILSLTWRFGTFDSSKMRGPGGMRGGAPSGPPPGGPR